LLLLLLEHGLEFFAQLGLKVEEFEVLHLLQTVLLLLKGEVDEGVVQSASE